MEGAHASQPHKTQSKETDFEQRVTNLGVTEYPTQFAGSVSGKSASDVALRRGSTHMGKMGMPIT
ncbi:hypothetical protein JYU34_020860 [Plutella xylostella]|uniref:Uncharacterized protein n=1 Tax=Plutella xylostella TaxID=51655 RepID=A0ABQ7PSE1_PLUXY|nr:hypothetical protein JYU34_020860 [Plutella xylostella]